MNAHVPAMGIHPSGAVGSVSCAADGCHYLLTAGLGTAERYAGMFKREHAVQYEPGRAPDIEVDYIISADCSICEDGGDVDMTDSDTLSCSKCSTTWNARGEHGERAV